MFNEFGDTVGAPVVVDADNPGNHYQRPTDITWLSDGGFVLAWEEQLPDSANLFDVYAQIFNADGTHRGDEILLNEFTEGVQVGPALTNNKAGFTVTFSSDLDVAFGSHDVKLRAFGFDGTPRTDEILVNTHTPGSQIQSSVITLKKGGVAVFYTSQDYDETLLNDFDGYTSIITSQTLDNDGNQVAELAESYGINVYAEHSKVTRLLNGNLVMVFSGTTRIDKFTTATEVYVNIYSPDGTKALVDFALGVGETHVGDIRPSVTRLADGGFAVVWAYQDNSTGITRLRMSINDADGEARLADFDVPGFEVRSGNPIPMVADIDALDDGNILVTWAMNSDPETGYDDIFSVVVAPDGGIPHLGTCMDHLIGDAGPDVFHGNDCDDILEGKGGADTLFGDADNDRLDGGSGNDTLRGGTGNDTIDGGAGKDKSYGGAGNDVMRGGAGNDILEGEGGRDKVFGDDGDDTLSGGGGADKVYGGAGDDNMSGGAKRDTLEGNGGNDTLSGDGGNDILSGNAGDDTLRGGAGRDQLDGGGGDDRLFGGGGIDEFRFDGGSDRVMDLAAGEAVLVLTAFAAGMTAHQVADTFGTDTGANYRLDFGGGDVLVFVGVNEARVVAALDFF